MSTYLKHVDDPLHSGWFCSSLREDVESNAVVGKGKYRGWQRWHKDNMFIDYNHPSFRGQWVACSLNHKDWYSLGNVKTIKEAIEVVYAIERMGAYEMDTA